MAADVITQASVTPVPAWYAKELGKNAYADNIGSMRLEWVVRIRTAGGVEGLTIANSYMRRPDASVASLLSLLRELFLGRKASELVSMNGKAVVGPGRSLEVAFREHGWASIGAFDLVGKSLDVSCVEMLGGPARESVEAYDSTLYFQDFLNPELGAGQCAVEALEAVQAGYRQIKIKTGRGGRWMLPEAGMRRDVEVVHAIRDAVGPDVRLMVDANFGYDGHLPLLEDFVRETAPDDLFWLEEMITADVAGYRALRTMVERHGSRALLVCGEVDRSPISPVWLDLIREKLIDGYQPDIVSQGFLNWLSIERSLEASAILGIPHDFGNGVFGVPAGVAWGLANHRFAVLESERSPSVIYDMDGYRFANGAWSYSGGPGLGISIDEETWGRTHAQHETTVEG